MLEKPSFDQAEKPTVNITISQELLHKFCHDCFEILEQAEKAIFQFEENSESLSFIDELFRSLHNFKGNCGFIGLSTFEAFSHKLETLIEYHQISKTLFSPSNKELVVDCLDILHEAIFCISSEKFQNQNIPVSLFNDIATPLEALANVLNSMLKAIPMIEEAVIELRKHPQAINSNTTNFSQSFMKEELSVRVDVQKLEVLQAIVSELLITHEMIIHNPDLQVGKASSLNNSLERFGRVANELQDISMRIRMLPIATIFNKMPRLVREVSRKIGKRIKIEMIGSDIEVDKRILDLIAEPLLHLVRNACDHGIDTTVARVKRQKDPIGKILLQAETNYDRLTIVVEDDGRGINKEDIFNKAVEKGYIQKDCQLTDQELFQFLFYPGFSTASKITDISGRGIGLDVVQNRINQLKGFVYVETVYLKSSKFILSIPLLFATVEVMLVKVRETIFSIPISNIIEAIQGYQEISISQRPDGVCFIKIREQLYNIIPISNIFNIESQNLDLKTKVFILVEINNGLFALMVDQILYQTQAVRKTLSPFLRSVKSISGFNILGTNDISLILNLEEIVKIYEAKIYAKL